MPIITTLVIGGRLARSAARSRRPQQRAIRPPQLADDLGGGQVAVEALLPVEQNAQSSAQPTWVETHSVPRTSPE